MRRTWLLSLGVLAGLGCGSSSRRTVDRSPRVAAGPPDIPAMRTLLDRYSPTGSWIVHRDETLPREFVVGGRKITLSSSSTFATWITDGDPARMLPQMSTAVHETYHTISTRLGYQLLVEAKAPEPIDAEGVYTGGAPMLVEFSALYPAREMDATFPKDAVTLRYPVYVSPSEDSRGTQRYGVFGLLDEWVAYLHDRRMILDLWPWVRDEAPKTADIYGRWRHEYAGMWLAYAEFKLFILHYLVHARAHRPDVYSGLVGNASFRRAFVAVDDAWEKLLADGKAVEPAIVAIAAERGAADWTYGDPGWPELQRVLATEPYQRALTELRGR